LRHHDPVPLIGKAFDLLLVSRAPQRAAREPRTNCCRRSGRAGSSRKSVWASISRLYREIVDRAVLSLKDAGAPSFLIE